jgi:hypothetical protein
MTNHETPLTRAYWQRLGEGTLYEEFGVVRAGAGTRPRRVDGVVVLGTPPRIASRDERGRLSLDGQDVIVHPDQGDAAESVCLRAGTAEHGPDPDAVGTTLATLGADLRSR